MLLFSDLLYILVSYESPNGSMCLRCLMVTSSGPVELLFLLCFITSWTYVVVSVIVVVCRWCILLLSMCLFVLCVLCLTVLVNSLSNIYIIGL